MVFPALPDTGIAPPFLFSAVHGLKSDVNVTTTKSSAVFKHEKSIP